MRLELELVSHSYCVSYTCVFLLDIYSIYKLGKRYTLYYVVANLWDDFFLSSTTMVTLLADVGLFDVNF